LTILGKCAIILSHFHKGKGGHMTSNVKTSNLEVLEKNVFALLCVGLGLQLTALIFYWFDSLLVGTIIEAVVSIVVVCNLIYCSDELLGDFPTYGLWLLSTLALIGNVILFFVCVGRLIEINVLFFPLGGLNVLVLLLNIVYYNQVKNTE